MLIKITQILPKFELKGSKNSQSCNLGLKVETFKKNYENFCLKTGLRFQEDSLAFGLKKSLNLALGRLQLWKG
jgi:hypothetical protein